MSYKDNYESAYAAAVARSAERSRTHPMQCRCGVTGYALYGGSSYCDNGIHHYQCDSCGAKWSTTRDWTEADWEHFAKSRWRAWHGRDPSPAVLDWLMNRAPHPGNIDCDCHHCKRSEP